MENKELLNKVQKELKTKKQNNSDCDIQEQSIQTDMSNLAMAQHQNLHPFSVLSQRCSKYRKGTPEYDQCIQSKSMSEDAINELKQQVRENVVSRIVETQLDEQTSHRRSIQAILDALENPQARKAVRAGEDVLRLGAPAQRQMKGGLDLRDFLKKQLGELQPQAADRGLLAQSDLDAIKRHVAKSVANPKVDLTNPEQLRKSADELMGTVKPSKKPAGQPPTVDLDPGPHGREATVDVSADLDAPPTPSAPASAPSAPASAPSAPKADAPAPSAPLQGSGMLDVEQQLTLRAQNAPKERGKLFTFKPSETSLPLFRTPEHATGAAAVRHQRAQAGGSGLAQAVRAVTPFSDTPIMSTALNLVGAKTKDKGIADALAFVKQRQAAADLAVNNPIRARYDRTTRGVPRAYGKYVKKVAPFVAAGAWAAQPEDATYSEKMASIAKTALDPLYIGRGSVAAGDWLADTRVAKVLNLGNPISAFSQMIKQGIEAGKAGVTDAAGDATKAASDAASDVVSKAEKLKQDKLNAEINAAMKAAGVREQFINNLPIISEQATRNDFERFDNMTPEELEASLSKLSSVRRELLANQGIGKSAAERTQDTVKRAQDVVTQRWDDMTKGLQDISSGLGRIPSIDDITKLGSDFASEFDTKREKIQNAAAAKAAAIRKDPTGHVMGLLDAPIKAMGGGGIGDLDVGGKLGKGIRQFVGKAAETTGNPFAKALAKFYDKSTRLGRMRPPKGVTNRPTIKEQAKDKVDMSPQDNRRPLRPKEEQGEGESNDNYKERLARRSRNEAHKSNVQVMITNRSRARRGMSPLAAKDIKGTVENKKAYGMSTAASQQAAAFPQKAAASSSPPAASTNKSDGAFGSGSTPAGFGAASDPDEGKWRGEQPSNQLNTTSPEQDIIATISNKPVISNNPVMVAGNSRPKQGPRDFRGRPTPGVDSAFGTGRFT